MDAALLVFASHGFEGASIRQIVIAADANVAAGHYYFGSKYALYSAVILRYLERINQTRYETLDQLAADAQAAGGVIPLRDLVKAYVEPHIRLSASKLGSAYANLMARFIVEQHTISAEIFEKGIYPMRERFAPHMSALFPKADEQQLEMCFQFIALTMVGAGQQNATWVDDPTKLETDLESVANFLTGGITAYSNAD